MTYLFYFLSVHSTSCLYIIVKLWEIPEDGLKEMLIEPIVDLVYHQKRVGLIEWHPTASNILVSSSKSILYYSTL